MKKVARHFISLLLVMMVVTLAPQSVKAAEKITVEDASNETATENVVDITLREAIAENVTTEGETVKDEITESVIAEEKNLLDEEERTPEGTFIFDINGGALGVKELKIEYDGSGSTGNGPLIYEGISPSSNSEAKVTITYLDGKKAESSFYSYKRTAEGEGRADVEVYILNGSGADYIGSDGTLTKEIPVEKKVEIEHISDSLLTAGTYSYVIRDGAVYGYLDFEVKSKSEITNTIELGKAFDIKQTYREESDGDITNIANPSYYYAEFTEGIYEIKEFDCSPKDYILRMYFDWNNGNTINRLPSGNFAYLDGYVGRFNVTKEMIDKYGDGTKAKVYIEANAKKNVKLQINSVGIISSATAIANDKLAKMRYIFDAGSMDFIPYGATVTVNCGDEKKYSLSSAEDYYFNFRTYFDRVTIYNDKKEYNYPYTVGLVLYQKYEPGMYKVKYRVRGSSMEIPLTNSAGNPIEIEVVSKEVAKTEATDINLGQGTVEQNIFGPKYFRGNDQLFYADLNAGEEYIAKVLFDNETSGLYSCKLQVWDEDFEAVTEESEIRYDGINMSVAYTPSYTGRYYFEVQSASPGRIMISGKDTVEEIKITRQPSVVSVAYGEEIYPDGMTISVKRNGVTENYTIDGSNNYTYELAERYGVELDLIDSNDNSVKYNENFYRKPAKYKYVFRDSYNYSILAKSAEITVKEPVFAGELFPDSEMAKVQKGTSGWVFYKATLTKGKTYVIDVVGDCLGGIELTNGGAKYINWKQTFVPEETGEYYIRCYKNNFEEYKVGITELLAIKDYYLALQNQPEYKLSRADYVPGTDIYPFYEDGIPYNSDIIVVYSDGSKEQIKCDKSTGSRFKKLGFTVRTLNLDGTEATYEQASRIHENTEFFWQIDSDLVKPSKPVRVKFTAEPAKRIKPEQDITIEPMCPETPDTPYSFEKYVFAVLDMAESEKTGDKYKLLVTKKNSTDPAPKYYIDAYESDDNYSFGYRSEDFERYKTLTIKPGKKYHFLIKTNVALNIRLVKDAIAGKDYSIVYEKNAPAGAKVLGNMTNTVGKKNTDVVLTKNAFTCNGYSFKGWNTKADGSGTSYADRAKVKNLSTDGSAVKLYAMWEINSYAIRFHKNGAEYSEPVTGYKVTSAEIAIPDITATVPGFTFDGWYDNINYTGEKVTVINPEDYLKDIDLYAKFIADKYIISFESSLPEGGYAGSMPDQEVYYGADNILDAMKFTNKGKLGFAGWTTVLGGKVATIKDKELFDLKGTLGTIKTNQFTNNKLTLYAVWDSEFNLDYDPVEENAKMSIDSTAATKGVKHTKYEYGKSKTLAIPVLFGHTFDGWYTSYVSENNVYDGRVKSINSKTSGDLKLFAKWIPYKYSVKFNANGGKANVKLNPIKNIVFGEKTLIPDEIISGKALSKDGYTFVGYTTAEYAARLREFSTEKTNIDDIIAEIHKQYDTPEKAVPIIKIDQMHDIGTLATKNNQTIVLSAVWATKNYTVTLKTADGKWTGNGFLVRDASTALLSKPSDDFVFTYSFDKKKGIILPKNTAGNVHIEKSGFDFSGWYECDGNKFTKKVTTTKGMNRDLTLYALWGGQYTVNFVENAPEGKTVLGTMNPQSGINLGKPAALTRNRFSTTDNSYKFMGWAVSANSLKADFADGEKVIGLPVTINAKTGKPEATLYAVWRNRFTIKYVSGNGMMMSSYNDTYSYGDEKTLPTPLRSGYTFTGWFRDSALKSQVRKITKTTGEDYVLYPKWKSNRYKIEFMANAPYGLKAAGRTASQTLSWGASNTLNKVGYRVKGYDFVGWSEQAIDAYEETATVDESLIFAKNGDTIEGFSRYTGTKTLYAVWKKTEYTVTYKGLLSNMTIDRDKCVYTVDSGLSLPEPSRMGYTFVGWYLDPGCRKKATDIEAGTIGNKTFYAKWQLQK